MASSTNTNMVALVTGCTPGGIGWALAKELRKEGYRVFATIRKGQYILGLEDCDILNLDVTDPSSVKAAAAEVLQKAGGLDMLVNNAGVGAGRCPILDADIDKSKALYDANVWGVLRMIQAFVPLMMRDGLPPPGRKRIVNIGSVGGLRVPPFLGIYGSSKSALQGLSDALRLETANLNLSITVVHPGGVATNFVENSDQKQQNIPVDSYYRHNWEAISSVEYPKGIEVGVFAKKVVAAITARSPPAFVFAGEKASVVRFLVLLPYWIVDAAIRKPMGAHLVAYKN